MRSASSTRACPAPRAQAFVPFVSRRGLLSLALAILTGACAGGDTTPDPVSPAPPVAPAPDPTPPSPATVSLQLELVDRPAGSTPLVTLRSGTVVRTASASGRIDGLPIGHYEVSAQPLVVGGITWQPLPATQSVTLTAGGAAPVVTIRYRADGASLVLATVGLPAYARATVRLTDGAGVTRTALSRDTVRGLSAGDYRLTTDPVETTDGRFEARPNEQIVRLEAEQMATASFAFERALGTLTVTVAGLPAGSEAGIQLAGPGGFRDQVDATRTLTGLSLGLYTANAARVRFGGFSYEPDATVRDVLFTAVQQRTLAFSYRLVTGAIAVTVSGLPEGTEGAVTVTGPDGYSRTLTGTETITDLLPGRYELTGADRTAQGVVFSTTPSSRTVTVSASLVATPAEFVYEGGYGQLLVEVTGLPNGIDAPVTVTGPLGYRMALTGTDTLRGLAPGSYTVSAATIFTGSSEYSPAETTQAIVVTARTDSRATVAYTETTSSSLAITIAGLPAGVNGAVLVSGPAGFATTVEGSAVLFGMKPGTYTLTAQAVSHDGFSYAVTPATRQVTLAPGSEAEVTIPYTATTGKLTVRLTGLPPDVATSITVTGANGFSRQLVGGGTLLQLAPGFYSVSTSAINANGTLWAPTPTQRTLSVAAGSVTTHTIAFAAVNTALTVTVAGLPSGAAAAISVSGPGGYARTITASETLSGLAAGTYTIAAAGVTHLGTQYLATPATQTVSLGAGDLRPVTVSYTANLGSLAIAITGLPAGTTAPVSVTGPGGYSESVGATRTLANLAVGSYTITATTVSSGGTVYTPTNPSQGATVTAGSTTSRTVAFLPGGSVGPNLVLEGAHVTQAIQNFAGTVPLVAGRQALLRVFVTTPSTNALQPSVRVRLYDGASLFRTFTINAPGASVPTAVTEGTLGSTWNATLTASDMRANLRIQVDVDPANTFSEPDETDNIWPRSGTAALDVRAVAPFNVVFVPVRQAVNDLTGNVTTSNLEGTFLSMTRRMFPLNAINASVRATYTTNAAALESGDGNGAWLTILSEMNALRVADGSAAHYYGVVNTSYSNGIAGYAYVPGRAGVGWDKPGSAMRVTAHELGHNFGRGHVAACGSSNTDANYPYSGGVIGNVGFNQGTGALVASSTTDIMGYCSTQWISDYTWTNVLNYRGTGSLVAEAFGATTQPTLMVWGRVRDGVVTLEPAVRMVTRPVVADRPGRYRLELRDELGRTMTGFTFTPEEIDHNGNAQAFAFAVPLDAITESRLVSVAIVGGVNGAVEQTASPVTAAMITDGRSPAPIITADDGTSQVTDPSATLSRNGSANRVTWDHAVWPAAIVRDAASGQVLAYLRTSGHEFVPRSASVRITFSNGIRSATREYPVR